MMIRSRYSILAAALALAACRDDRQAMVPTAPLNVASDAVSAYIAVSNPTPATGTQVTVWVRAVRGALVGPIGSFTVRLAYDSTRLHFVEAARGAQGMVMTNAKNAGVVVAAGASAEGFQNDELLETTFTVLGANAMSTLQLEVTELNSVKFEDQKSAVRVERGLYRDAAMKGK